MHLRILIPIMSNPLATYTFDVLDRPGLTLSALARQELVQEFRALAATALDPVPDYQCLSMAPNALDDKVIVVMRDKQTKRIAAFISAIYLQIPLEAGASPSTVLHAGLTCMPAALFRQGLVGPLFFHLFSHLRARPESAQGMWVTGLGEVPNVLVELGQYPSDVYPGPERSAPSETHKLIAKAVDKRYREAMLISPTAQFDEAAFVFRGSNPPGSCFRKDPRDRRFHHKDKAANELYLKLLGGDEGNEVLLVAFLDWKKVFRKTGSVRPKDSKTQVCHSVAWKDERC